MKLDEWNPWGISDGPWNANPKVWFFNQPGFPSRNVYEWDYLNGGWRRVWDNEVKKWRDLTEKEKIKFRDTEIVQFLNLKDSLFGKKIKQS